MKITEMLDIIHEMIVVDSEDGLISKTEIKENSIIATTKDNESFKVTVEKL